MDFGELFQIVIFLLIILSALFGAGRKKKERPSRTPPARHRRPPREPAPRRVERRPEPAGEADWLEALREQLEIAAGRAPAPPQPPAPPSEARAPREERPLEEIRPVEARSLETLEPAGEESHRRLHARLLAQPVEFPAAGPMRRGYRLPIITPRTAREAVVWREVFGPPKALE